MLPNCTFNQSEYQNQAQTHVNSLFTSKSQSDSTTSQIQSTLPICPTINFKKFIKTPLLYPVNSKPLVTSVHIEVPASKSSSYCINKTVISVESTTESKSDYKFSTDLTPSS